MEPGFEANTIPLHQDKRSKPWILHWSTPVISSSRLLEWPNHLPLPVVWPQAIPMRTMELDIMGHDLVAPYYDRQSLLIVLGLPDSIVNCDHTQDIRCLPAHLIFHLCYANGWRGAVIAPFINLKGQKQVHNRARLVLRAMRDEILPGWDFAAFRSTQIQVKAGLVLMAIRPLGSHVAPNAGGSKKNSVFTPWPHLVFPDYITWLRFDMATSHYLD
ncbi:hypothetical protein BT63DRAFT_425006 [Microthyrium microscopicum]|uniref:Uncharacterized protein n=1 Tax=Microthyrium microscopicum TaxID=703497 RepID=A0A6A6UCU7_9PEZI|nr:hypothetical protein BT63DRAFT_425006 [Microthyrium microscopicum]